MIRLAVAVEGETEEEFIKSVLAAPLSDHGVHAYAICLRGNVSVERLVSEMVLLQWDFDAVTSLVDFYGFRGKLPGETAEQLEARVDNELQSQLGADLDASRVFAYVQRHEFEGLLFSEVGAFGALLDPHPDALKDLQRVRESFSTPEDINDAYKTAPSRRIQAAIPLYRKRTFGPLVAEEIGLTKIREECPRFGSWMDRLESLGNYSAAAG